MIKLNELMSFTAGQNTARIQKSCKDDMLYTAEDLDSDLAGSGGNSNIKSDVDKDYIVKSDDCIICTTRSQAGITTKATAGKYLNINYVKCRFDRDVLDPWYFCYIFNESPFIRRQIAMFQQGTSVSILKLTIKIIGDLSVKALPDIKTQKTIGSLYRQALHTEYLMKQRTAQIKQFTLQMLRNVDEN